MVGACSGPTLSAARCAHGQGAQASRWPGLRHLPGSPLAFEQAGRGSAAAPAVGAASCTDRPWPLCAVFEAKVWPLWRHGGGGGATMHAWGACCCQTPASAIVCALPGAVATKDNRSHAGGFTFSVGLISPRVGRLRLAPGTHKHKACCRLHPLTTATLHLPSGRPWWLLPCADSAAMPSPLRCMAHRGHQALLETVLEALAVCLPGFPCSSITFLKAWACTCPPMPRRRQHVAAHFSRADGPSAESLQPHPCRWCPAWATGLPFGR